MQLCKAKGQFLLTVQCSILALHAKMCTDYSRNSKNESRTIFTVRFVPLKNVADFLILFTSRSKHCSWDTNDCLIFANVLSQINMSIFPSYHNFNWVKIWKRVNL